MMKLLTALIILIINFQPEIGAADRVVYEGNQGPGKGKHIVFVTGDEEYRS